MTARAPYLLAALLFSSCQVVSPPSLLSKVTGSVPSHWTATDQAQAGVDTAWVKRFKDQKLEALVSEGLSNNLGIQASAERVKQAEQKARVNSSSPTLSLGGSGTRQQTNFLGTPFNAGGVRYNAYGVSMNAAWEIDLWGKVRAGRRADLAAYESQRWMQRGAEASLKAQIVKAYFALCEANKQVSLAEQALKVRKDTRDAISDRYYGALTDEGGSGAEVRVSESDVSLARAEVSRWKSQRESAARQLELIIGRYPSAQIKGKATLPALPSTPPVGLPSELLLRRPDVLSAERNYASAIQSKVQANRAVFPSFSLTGSTGTATSDLDNVLDSRFGVWSIGGSVTQYILTGGALQTEKVMRRSEVKARLTELHDTVLYAFGEVEEALSREKYLKEQLSATRQAYSLAQEAQESAQADFRDGAVNLQTLLNAENVLVQTASAVVSLERLLLTNRVDLHLALGGDYKITKN